jgi:Domain of unknown function (DUF4440)
LTRKTAFAAITLLCCLTLTINLQAQAGDDVAQKVKQLQEDTTKAQLKNDASWLKEHLADGYVAGNSWGAWQTKDDLLKQIQKTPVKWKSGDISDVHVATFGPNVAVSRYTFTYDAEISGTHRARTVICSDTWVNDSGTWKNAASHCSFVKGK